MYNTLFLFIFFFNIAILTLVDISIFLGVDEIHSLLEFLRVIVKVNGYILFSEVATFILFYLGYLAIRPLL